MAKYGSIIGSISDMGYLPWVLFSRIFRQDEFNIDLKDTNWANVEKLLLELGHKLLMSLKNYGI